MNIPKNITATGLALATTLTLGSFLPAYANGKADSTDSFRVSGTIVEIDRDARTIVVQSGASERTTVHVPAGGEIRLSRLEHITRAPRTISFEYARRGQHVNMLVVKSDAPVAAIK